MAIARAQDEGSNFPRIGGAAVPARYLRTAEVAARLGIEPKTLRNKIGTGLFREREHFFRPPGLGLLWKWEAIVATIEGKTECPADSPVIPLARPTRGRRTPWE